jgi:hypothetical protein
MIIQRSAQMVAFLFQDRPLIVAPNARTPHSEKGK